MSNMKIFVFVIFGLLVLFNSKVNANEISDAEAQELLDSIKDETKQNNLTCEDVQSHCQRLQGNSVIPGALCSKLLSAVACSDNPSVEDIKNIINSAANGQ